MDAVLGMCYRVRVRKTVSAIERTKVRTSGARHVATPSLPEDVMPKRKVQKMLEDKPSHLAIEDGCAESDLESASTVDSSSSASSSPAKKKKKSKTDRKNKKNKKSMTDESLLVCSVVSFSGYPLCAHVVLSTPMH